MAVVVVLFAPQTGAQAVAYLVEVSRGGRLRGHAVSEHLTIATITAIARLVRLVVLVVRAIAQIV